MSFRSHRTREEFRRIREDISKLYEEIYYQQMMFGSSQPLKIIWEDPKPKTSLEKEIEDIYTMGYRY